MDKINCFKLSNRRYRSLLIFIITFSLFIEGLPVVSAYAASNAPVNGQYSWIGGDGGGIYSPPSGGMLSAAGDFSGEQSSAAKESTFVRWINELVFDIADGINGLMSMAHLSMDKMMFGRVLGNGVATAESNWNPVAYFTFEMEAYNPYGVIGSFVYSIFRTLSVVFAVIFLAGKIVKASYAGTGKTMSDLKDTISTFIIVIGMIYLMPNILDLVFYIRDTVLYSLGNAMVDIGGAPSIVETMRLTYYGNPTIINAFMYLASDVLTIFLGVMYIGNALGMVVLFCVFPLVAIVYSLDRQSLSIWGKEILGCTLVPVIDVVLLLIPTLTGMLASSGFLFLIQFLMCCMIVPSREMLKRILGVGASRGLAGAAIGGVMTGVMLARNAGRQMRDVRDKISGGIKDARLGSMHKKMDREEIADARNEYSGKAVAEEVKNMEGLAVEETQKAQALRMAAGQATNQKEKSTLEGQAKQHESRAKGLRLAAEQTKNTAFERRVAGARVLAAKQNKTLGEFDKDLSNEVIAREMNSADNLNMFSNTQDALNARKGSVNKTHGELTVEKERLNQRRNNLSNKLNGLYEEKRSAERVLENPGSTAEQRAEAKAKIGTINSNIDAAKSRISAVDSKIADNRLALAKNANERTGIDNQLVHVKEKINTEQDNLEKAQRLGSGSAVRTADGGTKVSGTGTVGAGSRNAGGGAMNSELDNRLMAIQRKQVNYKNFDKENGTTAQLSHAEMAKMYKRRAVVGLASGVGSAVGGLSGAALGFGSMMFMSGSAKMVGAVAGASAGGFVGDIAGKAVGNVAYGAGQGISAVNRSIGEATFNSKSMNVNNSVVHDVTHEQGKVVEQSAGKGSADARTSNVNDSVIHNVNHAQGNVSGDTQGNGSASGITSNMNDSVIHNVSHTQGNVGAATISAQGASATVEDTVTHKVNQVVAQTTTVNATGTVGDAKMNIQVDATVAKNMMGVVSDPKFVNSLKDIDSSKWGNEICSKVLESLPKDMGRSVDLGRISDMIIDNYKSDPRYEHLIRELQK